MHACGESGGGRFPLPRSHGQLLPVESTRLNTQTASRAIFTFHPLALVITSKLGTDERTISVAAIDFE